MVGEQRTRKSGRNGPSWRSATPCEDLCPDPRHPTTSKTRNAARTLRRKGTPKSRSAKPPARESCLRIPAHSKRRGRAPARTRPARATSRRSTRAGWPGGAYFGTARDADFELLPAHPSLAQLVVDLLRHPLRQVDRGVLVEDLDAADVRGVDAGLVRDRPDDITRLHAVRVPHLEPIPHLTTGRRAGPRALLARRLGCARRTLAARRVVPRLLVARPVVRRLVVPRLVAPHRVGRRLQRPVLLREIRERGGDLARRLRVLTLVAVDERREKSQVLRTEHVGDRLLELQRAAVDDVRARR